MRKLKSKNIYELDSERLATTDEHGNRVYLYPEEAKGVWKERRKFFYWFLISVYLFLPWINVNGKPALQVDIFNREFTFLGSTLHGVEPVLFFLMIASGLFFIAFITSLLGRVWCGWACPQTVFIQTIYWKIEALVEGSARKRRELDQASWSMEKGVRRLVKWILFTIISLHIAHTFVGYFVGPRVLLQLTTHNPSENWGLFIGTMILTAIFLLDFGWFREQFCIIACPYGRIQSVMMDENSLVIAYDVKRGEPRRGTVDRAGEGDCINCYNCVKVCPTGIDIRRGNQLECIHCTQCIDACDDIMTKLKKPKGLIRYASENELNGKPRKTMTLRSGIYIGISLILISAFAYFLKASTNLNMVFLRSNIPFRVIEDGQIVLNDFKLKLTHQGSSEYKLDFRIKEEVKGEVSFITPSRPLVLNKPEVKIIFFFRFNRDFLSGGTKIITVEALDFNTGKILAEKEVTLVGPSH